jgi:hypothetical protein
VIAPGGKNIRLGFNILQQVLVWGNVSFREYRSMAARESPGTGLNLRFYEVELQARQRPHYLFGMSRSLIHVLPVSDHVQRESDRYKIPTS